MKQGGNAGTLTRPWQIDISVEYEFFLWAACIFDTARGSNASYELTPEQFGYKRCDKKELTGGSPEENAEITRAILSGEEQGAKRQAVCLNAGAALYITGKTDTIEAGSRMAEKLIDSGAAAKKLEEFLIMLFHKLM